MENILDYTGVNAIHFHKRFLNDEQCYEYIAKAKWYNDQFKCKKCGYDKYCKGKKPYSRRCLGCKYDESPTAGTMFDKVKFSLHLSFHIIFKICARKKGLSSIELSKEFGLRQKTCWAFKWKLQQAMKSSRNYPLTGEVHVDECLIGGAEEQKRGRNYGEKKLIIVALEIVKDGVGRAYAEVIEDASSKSFKPFFKKYISKDATVKTDEWRGYKPLIKDYPNLVQIPSESGKGFPDMHIHIMNLKGWLRGVHHHCSNEHMQGYLDEYHFRYNRRNNEGVIFNSLIKRMVKNNTIRMKSIKQRDV